MTPEAGAADGANILLVDDLEDNLVALEAVLSALDVPLVRARSGEQALAALRDREFAVVLLDAQMPGMDGFATAAHIKRLEQAKDVPIIFLTGAHPTEAGYPFRNYATGAADYLTKPFDPWVLRAKVTVFLDLHRKYQQLRRLLHSEHERLGTFAERLRAIERQLSHSEVPELVALEQRVGRLEETTRELHDWLSHRAPAPSHWPRTTDPHTN